MELAIFSARVFTGDPKLPLAQAVAVKDGRVLAVGDDASVKRAVSTKAQIYDLPGRLVTPGLVDAHCHFVNYGNSLQIIDLRGLPSLSACREKIKAAAAKAEPGKWLLGRAWNHHQWAEKREPGKFDLDDITPDNPAMMVRACGHSTWVNSLALEAAGIDRNTPEPPGGRIDRDERGDPVGLLREARKLIEAVIPPSSLEERKSAALLAQASALKSGLTQVHSCESLFQWEPLASLEAEGRLKIRVHHLLPPDDLAKALEMGLRPGQGSERLWFGQVKLFADGSLGAGTAFLHEPYCDAPGQVGLPFLPLEVLTQKVELAYAHGASVGIHAIGDKAVSNSLSAIATARIKFPGPRRDRVEHVQLVRPEDIKVFQDLGVVASVQPVFVPTDWAVAERRWGHERCKSGGYVWKTFLEAGLKVQFGSDAPVEPIAPILGLQAAVTRQTTSGEPAGGWFPEQKLSLEQAITGFTATAAWTAHKEKDLGAVRPGKWADLTVFSQDLFKVPAQDWPQVPVEMTIIDGEVVYQK